MLLHFRLHLRKGFTCEATGDRRHTLSRLLHDVDYPVSGQEVARDVFPKPKVCFRVDPYIHRVLKHQCWRNEQLSASMLPSSRVFM